jgi:hypothetical protein
MAIPGEQVRTYEPGERVQYVVGRRVGTIANGPIHVDREEPNPYGGPTVTQHVRWDDEPDRAVAWHTWTLRPERTEPQAQPELRGCA